MLYLLVSWKVSVLFVIWFGWLSGFVRLNCVLLLLWFVCDVEIELLNVFFGLCVMRLIMLFGFCMLYSSEVGFFSILM